MGLSLQKAFNAATVVSGTGNGIYAKDATVTITADAAPTGKQFKEWTGVDSLTFVDGTSKTSSVAKFTMPASAVNVTATYEDIPISITGIDVSPKTVNIQKGTSQSFTATVSGTGAFDNTVTWSVEGANSAGITITSAGMLTVDAAETATTLIVKATANGDNAKTDTAIATVTTAATYSVTISGGGTGATGSGYYTAGTTINIYAGNRGGYTFTGWTSSDVAITNANNANASFTMPDKAVIVTANWKNNGGGSE